MGDPRGFLRTGRLPAAYRPVRERVSDWAETAVPRSDAESRAQASRCMDCGTPFCNWGCPLGNWVPEWNDLVHRDRWKAAFELLEATNNLPEVTGRLCPAPCEYACVLGINDGPVTVRENELAIVERAFREGFARPLPPARRTGRKVAVVGSGPAGLACAAQLNRAGHAVTVLERDDRVGGILRYGIPDFKLAKEVIDRRIRLWEAEGIVFRTGVRVGSPDYPASRLLEEYDAACLAGGSRSPRDLPVEGRDLAGIHFAMDYLVQANRRAAGDAVGASDLIDARGRKVVVIGGGDTGADCVGTAHRQGASCVVQLEVLPPPPDCRPPDQPWPRYPMLLRTSSSHEEGGERRWSVLTRRFIGEAGRVAKLSCARVEYRRDESDGCPRMKEVSGIGFELEADLVILAVGFLHPEKEGLLAELDLELDSRGNVKTDANHMTSVKGIFAAGDMRRGQSLIVWALAEGRRAARAMDIHLTGSSSLPGG